MPDIREFDGEIKPCAELALYANSTKRGSDAKVP